LIATKAVEMVVGGIRHSGKIMTIGLIDHSAGAPFMCRFSRIPDRFRGSRFRRQWYAGMSEHPSQRSLS
jgi:hypothetical protein